MKHEEGRNEKKGTGREAEEIGKRNKRREGKLRGYKAKTMGRFSEEGGARRPR